MRSRGPAIVAAAILASAGCTHDFDGLLVSGDGSISAPPDALTDTSASDTTSPDVTPADVAPIVDTTPLPDVAPCVPASEPTKTCTDAATACTVECRKTSGTCTAACGNPGCRKKCDDEELICRSKCESTCRSCTKSAGCEAGPQCVAAVK